MPQYTNLHTHTTYSMLDGYGQPDAYARRARELGMSALAITDHGGLHGLLEFREACVSEGVKPLLGCETYLARKTRFDRDDEERATSRAADELGQQHGPMHLTVVARTMQGYKNLIQLGSRAYLEGYYQYPRCDRELLSDHGDGLIILTGCLNGPVSQALMRGDEAGAYETAAFLRDCVGPEHFGIEVMDHGIPEEKEAMKGAIEIARKLNARLVPTGDCHYVHAADAEIHDTMLCVSTRAMLQQEDRFKFNGPHYYLQSYEEMANRFPEEWLANTLHFADAVDLDLQFGELFFPDYPLPPGEETTPYLERLVWEGMKRRYGDPVPDIPRARAQHELEVVRRMGFEGYFLVVWDLVNFARQQGIRVGPGRGSAAGSILSYALGITGLDPLRFNLLFERFLVEGRKSMPDIDLDFDDRFRNQVVNYAREKYGEDHVAHICTFCLGTGTRVLTSDLRWERVEELRAGDELFAFDEEVPSGEKESRKWRRSEVVTNQPISLPSYRITTDRGQVVASAGHMWLGSKRGRRSPWCPTEDLRVGDRIHWLVSPWDESLTYEHGWLAGIFDGEGSFDEWTVCISQNDGPVMQRVQNSLDRLGFDWGLYNGSLNCKQVKIRGGLSEVIRFMGTTRPTRLLEKFSRVWEGRRIYGKRTGTAEVTVIEYLGAQEVWAIETSTKTLIAEGYLSHNSTVGARQAIRDAGRVLGFDYSTVDKIAKMVPAPIQGVSPTMEEALQSPDLAGAYNKDPQARHIIETAKGLEGLIRQPGVHAAGVVISQAPTVEFVPVMRKGDDKPIVTQWDMDRVEQCGQLKIDFLALRNLSVLDMAIEMIKERHGVVLDPDKLPLDDEATFQMLCAGHSQGVFQLESIGMRELMLGLQPGSIEDLMALVSLFRPGPLGSNLDRVFIKRKQGRAEVAYDHPALEPVLSETQGILLYQEQILAAARELAGFSAAEADDLRKAIGKKQMDKIGTFREAFVEGCQRRGDVPRAVANKIYSDIEFFGGYGFNASHAASYALIAYWTAWFKCHYPPEYMAALLSSAQDDRDRTIAYLRESRRMGIRVRPPNVDLSDANFRVLSDDEILFGLMSIGGVGHATADKLLAARDTERPYVNIWDFLRRCPVELLDKGTIERFICTGALDHLVPKELERPLPRTRKAELLELERKYLRSYITEHPLGASWEFLEPQITSSVEALELLPAGQRVTLAGVVSAIEVRRTKRGTTMYTCGLEDLTGRVEVIVFSKDAERLMASDLQDGEIIIVNGRLAKEGDDEHSVNKIFFENFKRPTLPEDVGGPPIRLRAGDGVSNSMITRLAEIVAANPGDSPVYLEFMEEGHLFVFRFKGWVSYEAEHLLKAAMRESF